MIALACVLFAAAWLWWTGLEMPARPGAAIAAWAAGALLLFGACVRAGRRLPPSRRASRAAAWAGTSAILAPLAAWAAAPLLDWAAPFLSARVFPSGVLAALARAFGIDARALPGLLVVQDLADVPAHATSWQQVGAPATLVVLLAFWIATSCRAAARGRAAATTAVVLLCWLPVRFLVITRLVEDLGWLGFHWHPLAVALSLLPGAFVAERLHPLRSLRRHPLAPRRRALRMLPRAGILAAGAGLLAFGLLWVPSGGRAEGRVLLDDAHSDWEWTAIPFDRQSYGRQSTYSYTCLLDYLRHHYRADANPDRELTDELLQGYDVLILKTPTRPYLESEREAVVRFVRRGGGVLLIGDHTNLFGMTTYMNGLADPLGVAFDTDDTFDLTTGAPSVYAPPALGAHPAVAHLPGLQFETSCTIKPTARLRPVISARGLGSEQVDYGHVNFFGDIQPDPEERWGGFLQAAARTFGRGRVVAFTDSTVFSNFSVFFRGKPELALGMVEHLNRGPGKLGAVPWLLAIAGTAAILGGFFRRRIPGLAPVGLAALAIGAGLGGVFASLANAAAQPLPPRRHPMTVVAFENRHSTYRLATLLEGVVNEPDRAFEAFFVATQRLHLFPRVAEDIRDALAGSAALVVINPASAPGSEEAAALDAWVQAGGSLLVMERLAGSHLAANAFLAPAGLKISAAFPGQTEVPSLSGLAIYGGEPARLDPAVPGPRAPAAGTADAPPAAADAPLVSVATVGRGRVVAVLGSERFSFQSMGPAFNDPTAEQRVVYERAYRLFEDLVLPGGWEKSCPFLEEPRVAEGVRSTIIAASPEGSAPR